MMNLYTSINKHRYVIETIFTWRIYRIHIVYIIQNWRLKGMFIYKKVMNIRNSLKDTCVDLLTTEKNLTI